MKPSSWVPPSVVWMLLAKETISFIVAVVVLHGDLGLGGIAVGERDIYMDTDRG